MATDVPVLIPHESVNDETVKLLRWLVEDGQWVEAEQAVAEVEGSKATFEVPSPRAGTVLLKAAVGEEVLVGAPLCHVRVAAEVEPAQVKETHAPPPPTPPPARTEPPPPQPAPAPVPHANGPAPQFVPRFSAAAQELIRQHNLTEEQFPDLHLVRAADVLRKINPQSVGVVESAPSPRQHARANGGAVRPKPDDPEPPPAAPAERPATRPSGNVDEVPLSRQKLTEIRYLREGAAQTMPSEVSVLVPTSGFREALLRSPEATSLTGLIIFEVARLLRRFPQLNACYAERSGWHYREVNIGFAVAGEFGLKVPVIPQADEKSLGQISEEVRGLLAAYAADSLAPQQLVGGTFTVSDLSGEGVFALRPLIARSQSAILGVGGETRLADDAGAFFSLTLSFDHQLADGLQAAQFLSDLATRLRHHEATLRQRTAPPACAQCSRTVPELKGLKAHLLQTVTESGRVVRVCSSCIAGF